MIAKSSMVQAKHSSRKTASLKKKIFRDLPRIFFLQRHALGPRHSPPMSYLPHPSITVRAYAESRQTLFPPPSQSPLPTHLFLCTVKKGRKGISTTSLGPKRRGDGNLIWARESGEERGEGPLCLYHPTTCTTTTTCLPVRPCVSYCSLVHKTVKVRESEVCIKIIERRN